MGPKISVIVPVYNVKEYLKQCLDSIINQSLKDIEVIIVEDESTDGSKEVVKQYVDTYPNVIAIYQANQGVSVARNMALDKASGEFVFYMDSDDFLELNCLEILYNKAIRTKADIVIYGHKEIYEVGNNIKESVINLAFNEQKCYSGKEVANMVLNCKFLGVVWNKLFRRENLIDNELEFEKGRYVQDWYPIFYQIYKSNNIVFVNNSLYNYRIRQTSTTSKKTKKNIDDYYYAANNILAFCNKNNFNSRDIEVFKVHVFSTLIARYYNLYCKNIKNMYKDFKKTNYSNMNVSSIKVLGIKNINSRMKINIISWNTNTYHILDKIETNIRGAIK